MLPAVIVKVENGDSKLECDLQLDLEAVQEE